ncbi:MAG: methionyl-tRNA formyltransferase [Campylobacterales bacterium]|nr:methionyl-tRNA formyltransferase [Campylobacterales bacterium]
MRVVFMGTPEYATRILEALLTWEKCEVVGVLSQPDKPAGRKMELKPPHVKEFLHTFYPAVPLFQPTSLKTPDIQETLRALAPDVIVVAAYGQLLPQTVLDIAPCINLHASLLPKYRGASPIQAAILAGDTYTGVSAMLMEKGLDTGAVLGLGYLPLKMDMSAPEVFEALASCAAKLTLRTLEQRSTLAPLAQRNALACYAPKITKIDGVVDFSLESAALYRRFQALTPWPGLSLANGVKLLTLSLESTTGAYTPGEILALDQEGVVIGCKKGTLRVMRVQAPSKKPLHVKEYLTGKRSGVGALFS